MRGGLRIEKRGGSYKTQTVKGLGVEVPEVPEEIVTAVPFSVMTGSWLLEVRLSCWGVYVRWAFLSLTV